MDKLISKYVPLHTMEQHPCVYFVEECIMFCCN